MGPDPETREVELQLRLPGDCGIHVEAAARFGTLRGSRFAWSRSALSGTVGDALPSSCLWQHDTHSSL